MTATDMTITEKPPKTKKRTARQKVKQLHKEKLEEFKRVQDEEIISILEHE